MFRRVLLALYKISETLGLVSSHSSFLIQLLRHVVGIIFESRNFISKAALTQQVDFIELNIFFLYVSNLRVSESAKQ